MFSARIMAQAKGLAIRTEKKNKAGETFITVLGSNRGGWFHFKQTFFLIQLTNLLCTIWEV